MTGEATRSHRVSPVTDCVKLEKKKTIVTMPAIFKFFGSIFRKKGEEEEKEIS